MIKAVFKSEGVKTGEYGKQPILKFVDLSIDESPLTSEYCFDKLKKFTKLKLQSGDVIQFEAEVDFINGLKLKYPKNVSKVDLSNLKEGYEYCINKYLKESRILTEEDARKEKLAYVRMSTLFGEELFRFINLTFDLNSLNWFLTEDGQKFCRKEKAKMDIVDKKVDIEKEDIKLEENKIGEDIKIKKRSQNLMDFLK